MRIINCVAKWPGAVHDARILRESPLFAAFESARKPFADVLLGDSGYMLRDWLLTPILNPHTPKEQAYTDALCVTRCTVERCIGVLKRRWHCLHGEIRLATRRFCSYHGVCGAAQPSYEPRSCTARGGGSCTSPATSPVQPATASTQGRIGACPHCRWKGASRLDCAELLLT